MGSYEGNDDRLVTDGGRKLAAYLRRNNLSITSFCKMHDLDRVQVLRAINGVRWKRMTVSFVHKIYVATDGEVDWMSWLPETARKPRGARRSVSRSAA